MARSDGFFLEVTSPQGSIFQGAVTSVSLPTNEGRITVLPHHTPLFTKLSEGEIEIDQNNKKITVVINGGFLEVKENSAFILSDYAIRAESIEIAKTEERKRKAQEKLKEKLDNRDFVIADKNLRISILELKVAQKIKKRQRHE